MRYGESMLPFGRKIRAATVASVGNGGGDDNNRSTDKVGQAREGGYVKGSLRDSPDYPSTAEFPVG